MSGPEATDVVVEGGKHVASGGVGMALLALAQRFFAKQDKDAGKLDAILAAVNQMSGRLDVMQERQLNTRADVDKLETAQLQLQLQFAELKGRFEHLSEQLAK